MSLRVLSAQRYSTRSYNNGSNPADDPALSAVFLLKCQAGNTFTDVGPYGYTVTNYGSVTSSTTTAKFASTASASFSGSNSLTVADNATLRPGTGSFTWEFWWYPTSLTSYRTPLGKGYVSSGDLLLQTGPGDGKIIVYSGGSAKIEASTAVTVNAWNHIALVRNGTAMALYLGGTSVGTQTNSDNISGTAALGIGDTVVPSGYGSAGFIQDVRLSNAAVYTAAFTPPGTLS